MTTTVKPTAAAAMIAALEVYEWSQTPDYDIDYLCGVLARFDLGCNIDACLPPGAKLVWDKGDFLYDPTEEDPANYLRPLRQALDDECEALADKLRPIMLDDLEPDDRREARDFKATAELVSAAFQGRGRIQVIATVELEER